MQKDKQVKKVTLITKLNIMALATVTATSHLQPIARAGLIAKGIVYCLFGVITFMAAFNINGQSANDTGKRQVFEFVYRQTGGQILLAIIALGLACYTIWRLIQTFADTEDKGKDAKGIAIRGRYLFSGAVYGALAFTVVRMLWLSSSSSGSGGDTNRDVAAKLLSQPMGQWLAGVAALIIAGIGIYQIYYGWSEKYKKHVDKVIGDARKQKILLGSGKLGYMARGIVWLLIAWLFLKAAINANAGEAGNTSKAFSFVSESGYGSYLLGAISFGLICYGIFSFVRAGYEDFT